MITDEKMAKDTSTMSMEKARIAPAEQMSYSLMGGGDLKPHIGHKIEVTGTTAKPMSDATSVVG